VRPLRSVGALAAAAWLAACATLEVKVGWDEKADFSKYKTWAWKPDGSIRDPIWARRFQDVLSDQLASDGLTQVDANQNPDLWGVVHARLSAETEVVSYDPGWGYGWGAWTGAETVEYQVPVGTILVDLVDVRLKRVVWQGKAKDVLSPDKSNEEREEKLVSVLAKMFAGYPPAPSRPE
jgi:Domain of unknown function (DUF4136)